MSSKPPSYYLLTPGPLSTSRATKEAMLSDWGSWDSDFNHITDSITLQLCAMAGGGDDYVCVPMQGSGTFAVESALGTLVPRSGRVLVLSNGAYGKRMEKTLRVMGHTPLILDKGDDKAPLPAEVDTLLRQNPDVTHVGMIHCETSSGILNPIAEIAAVVKGHGRGVIIDAMSSFGALPLTWQEVPFDAIVSSANKCIEGVPGFGFVIVRKDLLSACQGNAHSYSLDLYDQWQGFRSSGKWRFTPPTHVVVAFHEALRQHREEGGAPARLARYTRNRDVLVAGMRDMGFATLLSEPWLSPIIVTFLSPGHPNFKFDGFYQQMKERGFIIYPGKLTAVESFRLGCIGAIDATVIERVLVGIGESLRAMGVDSGRPEKP